jgi:seryl-tRNA synthetase
VLDLKLIRNHPDLVRQALAKRGEEAPIDEILECDEKWRQLIGETERLKAQRNNTNDLISSLKKEKKDAREAIEEMKTVSAAIKELDEQISRLEMNLNDLLLRVPNIPHESVPEGHSEEENIEIRRWGQPKEFSFQPRPHWDISTDLDIVDFERASKVSGARFVFMKGLGARLERALISFMLDVHTKEHGYIEIWPPQLVTAESMIGTGQLPKFSEDAFRCEGTGNYLIPTAEVPVTNIHRDEILDGSQLPLKYAAFSACFRSEAGSHGRDTRGLVRLHQFNKVELVKFTRPEDSYDELEKLVKDAETILQKLELPYRVSQMCAGDLGFTAAKKYDPEVWMPSYNRYVEISSCSNFEDFQARRANIKYRPEPGKKAEYVHTLNGSGLAIGRTVAAIIENYQQKGGTIKVPEALRPYMQVDYIGR